MAGAAGPYNAINFPSLIQLVCPLLCAGSDLTDSTRLFITRNLRFGVYSSIVVSEISRQPTSAASTSAASQRSRALSHDSSRSA